MDLTGMIESGGANPLLLFVVALALGALHGLEPGHSKTMMAAYIIAVRGSVSQAVLLGVSAAFSHSIIVWVLAALALFWGNELIGEQLEPWFMIVSGLLVLGIAGWMLWPRLQSRPFRRHEHEHEHEHEHVHAHTHAHTHTHTHTADHGHWQRHAHPHQPSPTEAAALDEAHMDAHARAHAAEIRERLASGRTGTWQTILFGLSGGLIPCPAAITVFILCLHLGQLALGIVLVSAFSLGLALTLVAVGVVAAMGLKAVTRRSGRFDAVMAVAPWASAALIAVIGLLIIWSGLHHLDHPH